MLNCDMMPGLFVVFLTYDVNYFPKFLMFHGREIIIWLSRSSKDRVQVFFLRRTDLYITFGYPYLQNMEYEVFFLRRIYS